MATPAAPSRRPLRVIVADSSFLDREAVVSGLRRMPGVEVCAACADLDELVAAIESVHPDVVVTDIPMPPGWADEGIRAASALRRSHPEVGVVILSTHVEPGYVVELFREGSEARAYLLKERVRDFEPIVAAARAVADGESMIDPGVVEVLITLRSQPQDSPLAQLSPREREILGEIATGKTNAAIAEVFHVGKRSVEKHVHAIFRKLGLGEAEDVSPRVKAALIFLAEESVAVGERRDRR